MLDAMHLPDGQQQWKNALLQAGMLPRGEVGVDSPSPLFEIDCSGGYESTGLSPITFTEGMASNGSQLCIAGGNVTTTICYLSDDGLNWKEVKIPAGGSQHFRNPLWDGRNWIIGCYSTTNIFHVSPGGNIVAVSAGLPIFQPVFDGSRYYGFNYQAAYCYRSIDARTWHQASPAVSINQRSLFYTNNTLITVGEFGAAAQPYVSRNNLGETWNLLPLYATGQTFGYGRCLHNGAVYITTNQGLIRTRGDFIEMVNPSFTNYALLSSCGGLLYASWRSNPGTLYVSYNDGTSFEPVFSNVKNPMTGERTFSPDQSSGGSGNYISAIRDFVVVATIKTAAPNVITYRFPKKILAKIP